MWFLLRGVTWPYFKKHWVITLLTLTALGAVAAWAGGASLWKGALRVTFWGALAMAITAAIGALFGTVV